ncbi:MAG: hypothetical protein ACPLKP_02955 [Microgenomates group bacterium]
MRRKRKKIWPTLFLALIFWISWLLIVFKYPPSSDFLIFLFFLLLFLALFFSGALVFKNSRRGLFLASIIIIFLLFRLYHLANFLNIFLLLAIFVTLEIYFSLSQNQKNN